MAFRYRIRTKRSGIGEKTARYYAVPLRSGKVSTRQLAKELSKMSSLSEGDVHATLIGLTGLIEKYLHDGYTVQLDNLGLLTISASSDGYDTPEECTPRHVKAKKICFRADTELKKNLKYISFEREK